MFYGDKCCEDIRDTKKIAYRSWKSEHKFNGVIGAQTSYDDEIRRCIAFTALVFICTYSYDTW